MRLPTLAALHTRLRNALRLLRANRLHAIRMLLGALLAFVVSQLLHLPEPYWAVITVMIVARPDVASAAEAGAHRLAGTLLGSTAGIAAAVARHHGIPDLLALAGMLALIAPFAATWAEFRAAPMAALIVSSTGPHGAAPIAVALLRLAEIGVGIVAGIVVNRALRRFEATDADAHTLAAVLGRLRVLLGSAFGMNAAPSRKESDALRLGLRALTLGARRQRHGGPTGVTRQAALAGELYTAIQFATHVGRQLDAPARTALHPLVTRVSAELDALACGLARSASAGPLPVPARDAAHATSTPGDDAQGALCFALQEMLRKLAALRRVSGMAEEVTLQ